MADGAKERLADLKHANDASKDLGNRLEEKYSLSSMQLEKSTKWREAIER